MRYLGLLGGPEVPLGFAVDPRALHVRVEGPLRRVRKRVCERRGGVRPDEGGHLRGLHSRVGRPGADQPREVVVVDELHGLLVVEPVDRVVGRGSAHLGELVGVDLLERDVVVGFQLLRDALVGDRPLMGFGRILTVVDGVEPAEGLPGVVRRLRLHDVEGHDAAKRHEDRYAGVASRLPHDDFLELVFEKFQHRLSP